MFTQPMLLKEELQQYPMSYCILHRDVVAEDFKLNIWSQATDILTSALVAREPVPEAVIQSLITQIRATLFKSGWMCLSNIRYHVYQTFSAEVLLPLCYSSRSVEDQDSMADYLQVCLYAGNAAAALYQLVEGMGPSPGEEFEVEICRTVGDLAKPASKMVTDAISKIKNTDIISDIEAEHRPGLMLKIPYGGGVVLVECSQCCNEDFEKLQRCARCRLRNYCDPECQKAHWNSIQKEECSRFAEVMSCQVPGALAAELDALAAD